MLALSLVLAACDVSALPNLGTGETAIVVSSQIVFSLPGRWVASCDGAQVQVTPDGDLLPLRFARLKTKPFLRLSLPPFPVELPGPEERGRFVSRWGHWEASARRLTTGAPTLAKEDVPALDAFAARLNEWSARLEREAQEHERATSPFLVKSPRRLGEIPGGEFAPEDVFVSAESVCVAQGRSSTFVRCFDTTRGTWGKRVDRASRVRMGELGRWEGRQPVSLQAIGVEPQALDEPLVTQSRNRDDEKRRLSCDSCGGHLPCPDECLLLGEAPQATFDRPSLIVWSAHFVVITFPVVVEPTTVHHALWLYERER